MSYAIQTKRRPCGRYMAYLVRTGHPEPERLAAGGGATPDAARQNLATLSPQAAQVMRENGGDTT